jgi:ribosomal protein S18 acetylase RimI-like enzyme
MNLTQSITIREATKDDALVVAHLSQETFRDTFAAANTKEDMDKFLKEQFTIGRLMLEVGSRDNYFFLAEVNGELSGYVKLRNSASPMSLGIYNAMEIARLYSVASMIGKGVGSSLMKKAIDFAIEMKKKALWLGVWEKNQRAIEFYKRWGFEKFGETDFLLGNDVQKDWLMWKKI